jgi:hypothetical protein
LNDVDRGRLTRPPELPGKSTTRRLVAKQEDVASEMINLAYEMSPYSWCSSTCRKILRYGADGFTSPPKEGVLRIFNALGWV